MKRPLSLAVFAGILTSTLSGTAGLVVAAPAPAMAAPSITGGFTSPEQLTYSLVSDSSHKGPATASSINLLFAPDSVLWLLATSSGGDLSYQGTWSYAGGKLTVRIDSGGFDRRGTFDPDFGLAEVVIPFQVFSGPPGTSTWDQHAADPVIGSYMVAEAAAAATANGLSITSIIDDAASYVAGVSGATLGSGESTGVTPAAKAATSAITSRPVDRPRLQLGHFAGAAAAPGRSLGAALARTGRLAPQRNFDTGITKVDLEPDGYEIVYRGTTVRVLLATELSGAGPAENLTLGPFASDPRTDFVPDSPHNSLDDPPNKRAVFWEPFALGAQNTWTWHGSTVTATVTPFPDEPYRKTEISTLESAGYEVQWLDGGDAGISGLITALSGPTPGVLIIRTHGDTGGDLFTDDSLGSNLGEAVAAQNKLNAELATEYGMPAAATDVGALDTEENDLPGNGGAYYLELTPTFWMWLHDKRGASFSHSLVFVGACNTDYTPYLREAIDARAYFAWRVPAVSETDAKMVDYTIAMLAKPTVTAEEVYYNLLRVDATSAVAFKQDNILAGAFSDQMLANRTSTAKNAAIYAPTALQYVFDGWGDNGGTLVPYIGNGWLANGTDEGQIWTMLWAARWGRDTKQGIKNLQGCWDGVWVHNEVGAINSTCQQWTDGNVPTKQELDYTIYLLTGQTSSLTGTPVPRFTLDDGGN